MNAPYQIPKPKNWQDLETLCLAIWKEEWNTTHIKPYGRQGQLQDGVDILAKFVNGTEMELRAIQCKCKAEDKDLTKGTIKAEVDKAKKFNPRISQYIIATTFDSDKNLDSFVAELSQQNIKDGYFSIELYGWQDIERLLELHLNVRDWYLNLTKPKLTYEFMIDEPSDSTLHPIYKKTHYINKKKNDNYQHKYNAMDLLGANYLNAIIQSYNSQKDNVPCRLVKGHIYHTRCKIRLSLKNTSNVTMKDVRVMVMTNPDVKFYHEKKELIGPSLKFYNAISINENYVSFNNMKDLHPNDKYLLDEFYLEPAQNFDKVELYVRVTAQDFEDEKVYKLQVEPEYIFQTYENDKKVGEPDSIEPYVETIEGK